MQWMGLYCLPCLQGIVLSEFQGKGKRSWNTTLPGIHKRWVNWLVTACIQPSNLKEYVELFEEKHEQRLYLRRRGCGLLMWAVRKKHRYFSNGSICFKKNALWFGWSCQLDKLFQTKNFSAAFLLKSSFKQCQKWKPASIELENVVKLMHIWSEHGQRFIPNEFNILTSHQ